MRYRVSIQTMSQVMKPLLIPYIVIYYLAPNDFHIAIAVEHLNIGDSIHSPTKINIKWVKVMEQE